MADTSNTYIVPINVQAIRVADSDRVKFKGPSTNFENAAEGLGWEIRNPLESSTSQINAGIHLHWALPDALTHGKQFPNGDVLFPTAPNRWLVTRYYSDFNTQIGANDPAATARAAAPKVAQWVVESNVIAPEHPSHTTTTIFQVKPATSPPVSLEGGTLLSSDLPPLPAINSANLGDWQSYDSKWKDEELAGSNSSQKYLTQLSAIDHYGPGFAAYYQNSLSVFGFFDDFSDIIADHQQAGSGWTNLNDKDANFSVSYQVVGWYSETSQNDILVKTLLEAQKAYKDQNEQGSELAFFYDFVAKELKWQLQEPQPTDAITGNWPTGVESLYNGLALNVQWLIEATSSPDNPEFLPSPTKVGNTFDLEIAIGNNTSEALSTMITNGSDFGANSTAATTADSGESFPNLEAHLEFLFNAFQQGLLRKLAGSEPDLRLAQLEEYLHSARFSTHKGGNIWNLRLEPDQGGTTPDTTQVEAQLPLAAAEMLSYLNTAQQAYDTETAALHSRQHQAFLDWTNLGLTQLGGDTGKCNPNTNPEVWDYLISELLQLYSESGKTGLLNHNALSGEQAGQLVFEAVWTNLNATTENYCLSLAKAQSQLLVLLPKSLQAVMELLQKALATLASGDPAGAISTLNQISQNPLATQLQQLQQLMQAENNASIKQLNAGLTDLKNNQQLYTKVLQSTDGTTPGLQQVKTLYEKSPFEGHNAITNFVKGWKDTLFETSNLLDGQEIYVLAQATNYNNFSVPVSGAKLLSAITETQNRLTAIASLIKQLGASTSTLTTYFKTTTGQLTTISGNVQQVIQLLTATPDSPIKAIGVLTKTIEQIADIRIDDASRVAAAMSLQQVWMPLLDFLPSGHRVIILARVLQLISTDLDQKLNLVTTPADPFLAPNDPVLLLTEPKGADQKNVLEPVNRNGRASLLPCRQPSDLLTDMQLNSVAINTTVLAGKTQVAKVFANVGSRMPSVQALLYEAYYLLPQASFDLLVNAAGQSATDLDDLIGLQAELAGKLKTEQEFQQTPPQEKNLSVSYPATGQAVVKASFTGYMPYYIGATWLGDFSFNPFLPLYMAWSATFNPLELSSERSENDAIFPAGYLTDNFTIGDTAEDRHVDLVCKGPMQLNEQGGELDGVSMSGQITLTSRASAPLLQQIKVFFLNALGKDISKGEITPADLKNDLQKDLYKTYEYFDKKVILSQAMSGFNERLLQQFTELPLPFNTNIGPSTHLPGELFAFLTPYLHHPQYNKTAVGGNTATGKFLPFRAGTMSLNNIFIVDAFGRYFEMENVQDKLYRATSMLPSKTCDNKAFPNIDKDVYLPPRIVQPSRLSFNWLSAQSLEGSKTTFVEHTQQAAASPICGWLFPNHLEQGLSIYDAGGKALGELNVEGSSQTTTWRGVPVAGPTASAGTASDNGRQDMLKALTGANTVLQSFLEKFAFPASGSSSYASLLAAMQKAQGFTHSGGLQMDKGLAVLIGQPLVLARATLRLDLQGLPSVALDSDSFCDSISQFLNLPAGTKNSDSTTWHDYELKERFMANFLDITLPVMMGDLTQFNDGLVGYFINDDWSTFYSPASTASTGGVQQSTFETLQLGLNYPGQKAAPKQIQLTMVMDPRASVHATTGILPVKKLSVPPAQYVDVMNRLAVYFLTNPVLLGQSGQNAQGVDFGNIPLPKEKGHSWLWTQPGLPTDVPLQPNFMGDRAHFGYSPQQILDGWLKLEKTEK